MRHHREHAGAITLPHTDPHPDTDSQLKQYVAYMAQLWADQAHSLLGVALQGALPVAFGYDKDGRGPKMKVSTSAGRLLGYSLLETAGHDVTVNFWDNPLGEASGSEVWHDIVTASKVLNFVGVNASFSTGLSVEFVTSGGLVRGVALLGGVD